MADGGAPAETLASPSPPTPSPSPLPPLRGLREKMVAAAQALADERRSHSGAAPIPAGSPAAPKSSARPVLDASILRTEERQRLARERREEREKQQAVRESQILEREKKAKVQYAKQLEEKQRRIREQKRKEELRRAAAEEKRKQKSEEDQERYEAVLHRTLERSQRLESRPKRWSWGGSGTDLDGGKQEPASTDEGSKRSTSSASLKPPEGLLHKRLSSSAARLSPPSKGSPKRSSSLNRLNNKVPPNSEQPESKGLQAEQKARRSHSGLPESSAAVSRLLAPTQASLARSKSAATLSADSRDPSAPANLHAPDAPLRSRSTDRLKAPASPPGNAPPESRSETPQGPPASAGRRAPSPSGSRRAPSPAGAGKRAPSPTANRPQPRPSSPRRQGPPPALSASKPVPVQRPSITPNVLSAAKRTAELACRPKEGPQGPDLAPAAAAAATALAAAPSKTKEDAGSQTPPATAAAKEAARIVAEKRRRAREQRERQEEDRVREGDAAEERAPGNADESPETADEGRRRAEGEKAAEVRLQREAAEAKALEEVAQQRQERERIMQRNKQERLARKKRIEEIMRRTRKAEQEEAKDKSNEEDEDEDAEKQDQPEKTKDDSSPGVSDGPELLRGSATLRDQSAREADDVFVNGNEEEEVGGGGGTSGDLTPAKEGGPPADETPDESPELPRLPESEPSRRFPSHPNGTPGAAWDLEEIPDLSARPRSAASGLLVPPEGPRLAFGEESCRASPLAQPTETASEP